MYFAIFNWTEKPGTKTYQTLFESFVGGKIVFNALKSAGESVIPRVSLPNAIGLSGIDVEVMIPIIEDIQFEVKSNFENQSDRIASLSGGAGAILDMAKFGINAGAVASGDISEKADWMNFQVWQNTEPFRFPLKINLETRNDPYMDVYLPIMLLLTQNIISKVGSTYHVPGINMKALDRIQQAQKDKASAAEGTTSLGDPSKQQSKKLSKGSNKILTGFRISTFSRYGDEINIVDLDASFITNAKPTWSREQTESGFPLWGELDIEIQSVFSANDSLFNYEPSPSPLSLSAGISAVTGKVANNIFR